MLRTVARRAQVAHTATTSPTPLTQLTQLPSNTGAGLFVEYPAFQPLGTPPTLLHVTLPSSTVLKTRTRSLVAVHGQLDGVSQKLCVLNLWKTGKPLLYNEVSSTSPLSLLLSDKNGFVNVPLEQEAHPWTVMDTERIAGWYGNVEFSNSITNGVHINPQSKGNLILTGASQVFTLDIQDKESIYVNPSSIVAFQGTAQSFHKLNYLEIPDFGAWNTIKTTYTYLLSRWFPEAVQAEPQDRKLVEVHEQSAWHKTLQWLSNKTNNILLKNRLFYQIDGPATLIVHNSFKPQSRTFTENQLTQIYNNLK